MAALCFAPHAALAAEPGRATLSGHVLPALSESDRIAQKSGAGDIGEALTLTVVLKHTDEAGFQQHLTDLYDPNSADFHRFSDAATIADRFGPDAATYNAVREYFTQHGFAVAEESANRLTLTVRAARSQVESALAIRIADFSLGDRDFHANENEPSLPADIAVHVQAIAGLSNLAIPQPNSFALPIIDAICALQAALPIATADNYTPPTHQQLFDKCVTALRNLRSYGNLTFDPPPPSWLGYDGTGQKIGLVEFDGYLTGDVRDFLEIAGFPATQISHLSAVHVGGGATRGANQNEVLLDIDTVLTIAPGADVVVYDAPFSGTTSFQQMFNAMINGGVDIISNSWAYCEDQTSLADVQSIDAILQAAAASGISVFNGSGDHGATCLDGAANTIGVPADAPHGTAVGGTSATIGAGSIYAGETWWDSSNASPPGGQGGFGVSRFFARPAYQNGFTSSTMRSIPDVAINADPATASIMICQADAGGCPTGLLYGGTSFAAPLWAALHARVNQSQSANIGDVNEALYPLAGTAAFHGAASMGSDFAHVGLGSGDFDAMHLLLGGASTGAVDATISEVGVYMTPAMVSSPGFSGIPADGTSQGSVVVNLRDALGNVVGGKTVTLAASAGSHVVITPSSAVTAATSGAAVFTIKDATAEAFTLTATDSSDGIVIAQTAPVVFAVPSAAGASIMAFPTTVAADGVSTTTITVTLRDAQNHPTPGKVVLIAQDGRAVVTGPTPPVTDANGDIAFTASDGIEQTVTFTAVDHTDGGLPVPGTAVVTYSGSAAGSCVSPPSEADDYALTPFINGFAAYPFFFGNVNWGCRGGTDAAFDANGNAYVAHFQTGALYRFGPDGGSATAPLATNLGPTLSKPLFGNDGRLYATHGATTGDFFTGDVVELDPVTGALLRVVASNLTCPTSIATDPLSGDLFFDDGCFGAGSDNPGLFRITDPAGTDPNRPTEVVTYATLPATPNGSVAFAPDGTIYVETGYLNPEPAIVAVTGTDQPQPPIITTVPDIWSFFWVNVGATQPNGAARSLIVLQTDNGGADVNLNLVDITTNPVQVTTLAHNIGSGTIGPDGCLYTATPDTVYKIAPTVGACDFAATNPSPTLALTPSTVSPNPTQGGMQTLTATFRNLVVPSGTAVFVEVRGANAQTHLVRTNASGVATFTYQGLRAGDDVVTATATVGADALVSNVARVTWNDGPHASLVDITGPLTGSAAVPVALSAALVDVSAEPPSALAGSSVHFAVGGQACDGTTAANGVASCSVTIAHPGVYTLTVSYAGNAQHLATSANALFVVPTDGVDLIFADGFEVFHGDRITGWRVGSDLPSPWPSPASGRGDRRVCCAFAVFGCRKVAVGVSC